MMTVQGAGADKGRRGRGELDLARRWRECPASAAWATRLAVLRRAEQGGRLPQAPHSRTHAPQRWSRVPPHTHTHVHTRVTAARRRRRRPRPPRRGLHTRRGPRMRRRLFSLGRERGAVTSQGRTCPRTHCGHGCALLQAYENH